MIRFKLDSESNVQCLYNSFIKITVANIVLNVEHKLTLFHKTIHRQSVDGTAPNFTQKPKMKQSDDGAKLTIETELSADPAPEIKWYRGDKILSDGGRLTLKTRKEGGILFLALEIKDVSEDDGGEYKIVAKNKLGSATNTIKLNFARKLSINRSEIGPTCNYTSY